MAQVIEMVTVLRLGERVARDFRINTHMALVARTFGVSRLVMVFRDEGVERSLESVNRRFGHGCRLDHVRDWTAFVRNWGGVVVHLTMYGDTLDRTIEALRESVVIDFERCVCEPDLLVIVGSEKVQRKVYELADHNTAIGNQPHSEIAALSVFLDRLFEGRQFYREFGGEWKIQPDPTGKTVVRRLPEKEAEV